MEPREHPALVEKAAGFWRRRRLEKRPEGFSREVVKRQRHRGAQKPVRDKGKHEEHASRGILPGRAECGGRLLHPRRRSQRVNVHGLG